MTKLIKIAGTLGLLLIILMIVLVKKEGTTAIEQAVEIKNTAMVIMEKEDPIIADTLNSVDVKRQQEVIGLIAVEKAKIERERLEISKAEESISLMQLTLDTLTEELSQWTPEVVAIRKEREERIERERLASDMNYALAEIARCESGNRHYDSNGNVLQGRITPADTGKYQINKDYHLEDAQRMGINLNSPEGNRAFAEHLWKTQGNQPWSASNDCHRLLG